MGLAWSNFVFRAPLAAAVPSSGVSFSGGKAMEILTRDEVLARLKCARATLYVLIKTAGFPRPFKLGSRNRWLKSEVEEYLARQAAARRN